MPSLAPQETASLIEFAEAEAAAEIYAAAPANINVHVARFGSAFAFSLPELPWLLFNRVVGLGLREPATEALVDDCLAFFREAGSAAFGFQLSPEAQPESLPAWLKARDIGRRGNWAKMIRRAGPVSIPTDLRIERIDAAAADDFTQVVVTTFGLPPDHTPWWAALVGRPGWHHYVAYADTQPVAAGMLFVNGDVGWLGAGSTLAAYRRRGAQGAIMARRISDAADLGCRWVATETGEDSPDQPNPSYHNMLRTGFSLAYLRPNYAPVVEE